MKCTNCGSEVPDTAKVCGNCGHRLKSASLGAVQTESGRHAKVRGVIPGWVWGLGGVVVTLAIGLVLLGFNLLGSKPPKVEIEPINDFEGTSAQSIPPTMETLIPTHISSPVPLPSFGLFPDENAVWNDWINGRLDLLRGLTQEKYAVDEGLLYGRAYFSYTVELSQDQSVLWDEGWCAVNEQTLSGNIANITHEYSINGQPIPQSEFGVKLTPNGSHYCYYQFIVLKDWPLGTHVVTTIKTFKENIYDGISEATYPPGRKVIEYNVNVSP